MSAMQRRKGARLEREIVELHRSIGIHAEPLVLLPWQVWARLLAKVSR